MATEVKERSVPKPVFTDADFVTPGNFPVEASSRKQMRQTPNLRIYARDRPHSLQRL